MSHSEAYFITRKYRKFIMLNLSWTNDWIFSNSILQNKRLISVWSWDCDKLLEKLVFICLLYLNLHEALLITLFTIYFDIFFINYNIFSRHWYLPILANADFRLGNAFKLRIVYVYWDLYLSFMGYGINGAMSLHNFFFICFGKKIISCSHS